MVAIIDRRADTDTGGQLLADTGENDDVRVDCHTDRQKDTRDTGQSQGDVKAIEHQCHHQDINAQSQNRRKTRQQIDHDHQKSDKRKTDHAGEFAGADRVLSQLGADDLGAESFELNLQSADTDRGSQVFRLFDRILTSDNRAAVSDRRLHRGDTDKVAIIVNTNRLFCGKSLGRSIRKSLLSFIIKGQGDNDLLVAHIVLLVARLGISDLSTGDDSISVRDDLVEILGKRILNVAFLGDTDLLIVFLALCIRLADEVQ